jgi:hypothetical protein
LALLQKRLGQQEKEEHARTPKTTESLLKLIEGDLVPLFQHVEQKLAGLVPYFFEAHRMVIPQNNIYNDLQPLNLKQTDEDWQIVIDWASIQSNQLVRSLKGINYSLGLRACLDFYLPENQRFTNLTSQKCSYLCS